MKLYGLKIICIDKKYVSQTEDRFLNFQLSNGEVDFCFDPKTDFQKFKYNLYLTTDKDEFINKSIPLMDSSDIDFIFNHNEFYKLEIFEIKI